MRPGTSGRDSIRSKQRSTSRSRTREQGGDRDAGDIRVGARGSPGLRRPQRAIGNGEDWNASQTSLRLAVGLQRDSVMENLPSPSRPSSLLPSMQGISGGYHTREDDLQLAVWRIHKRRRGFVSSLQLLWMVYPTHVFRINL